MTRTLLEIRDLGWEFPVSAGPNHSPHFEIKMRSEMFDFQQIPQK